MPPNMPGPDIPAPPAAPRTHDFRWNFNINVALLAAAIVACYLIRVWGQEKSCQCKLKALEEQRKGEGQIS